MLNLNPEDPLTSLIELVELFIRRTSNADPDLWQNVLDELIFAKEIVERASEIQELNDKDCIQKLSNRIIQQISQKTVLIQGGFVRQSNPEVLYQITKDGKDAFTLTVTSSGNITERQQTIDIIYNKLTLKKLQECFERLIQHHLFPVAEEPDTNSILDSCLLRTNIHGATNKHYGATHSVHKHSKLYLQWLFNRVGNKAYHLFASSVH